jgi:hypothetical protein
MYFFERPPSRGCSGLRHFSCCFHLSTSLPLSVWTIFQVFTRIHGQLNIGCPLMMSNASKHRTQQCIRNSPRVRPPSIFFSKACHFNRQCSPRLNFAQVRVPISCTPATILSGAKYPGYFLIRVFIRGASVSAIHSADLTKDMARYSSGLNPKAYGLDTGLLSISSTFYARIFWLRYFSEQEIDYCSQFYLHFLSSI